MSTLWWLALVPLFAAPLTYLLRRRGLLAGGLATSACLVAAGLSLMMPAGDMTELLGRLFVMDGARRLVLLFVFSLLAGLNFYPWPALTAGLFRPFALLGVALAAVGILAQSLLLSALVLELAALSMLVPLQAGGARPGRGAIGFLILVVVVTPCLLLVGWLIEGYPPTPESAWALRPISVLLVVGLGLIMGLVPFHAWWVVLVEEAPPAVIALIGAAFPGVALGLLVSVLGRFPWMLEEELIRTALLGLGLLSAVAGIVLGLLPDPSPPSSWPGRRGGLRRILGWWAVHDLGVIVIGVGTGSLTGLTGTALGLISRGLALSLVAMGLSAAEGSSREDSRLSLAWRWRALAILVGGWTLAGAPPSAAFPARWLVFRAAFDLEPAFAYLLILSAVLAVVSFLRGARALLSLRQPEEPPQGIDAELPSLSQEAVSSGAQIVVIAALFVLVVGLGFFPQLVTEFLVPQMVGFAFPP